MELEHQELRDLAAFFAKRFPSSQDRARLVRAAGLVPGEEVGPEDPEASWFSVLASAGAPALASLVRAARKLDPSDPFLQELEQIVSPPRDTAALRAVALGFGGVTTLGLGLLTLVSLLGGEPAAAPEAQVERPVLASVQSEVVAEPARVAEPAPSVEAPAAEGSAEAEAPVEVPPAPVVEKEREPAPVRRAQMPSKLPRSCFDHAQADGLVGYWYAGEEPPGSAGTDWTMPETVNVRAAYPSDDNHWSSKSEVRCVLPVGTPVKLGEPVRVPPGHWWIELRVDGDGVVGL